MCKLVPSFICLFEHVSLYVDYLCLPFLPYPPSHPPPPVHPPPYPGHTCAGAIMVQDRSKIVVDEETDFLRNRADYDGGKVLRCSSLVSLSPMPAGSTTHSL